MRGADSDELDQLAAEFDSIAADLEGELNELTRLLHNVQWLGEAASDFDGEWTSLRVSEAQKSAGFLREAGQKLRSNATEQRVASAAGGERTGGDSGGPRAGNGATRVPGRGDDHTPPDTPPVTPSGTTTSGGYQIGDPKEPEMTWDEDFVYDSEEPSAGDYVSWAEWGAKAAAARVARPDLDDALDFYDHYRSNSGEPATFDMEEAYREDANVRAGIDASILRTQAGAAELIAQGNTNFKMTGPAHGISGQYYPATENWQKTIGAYQHWESAEVTVVNGVATMTVTVHGEDYYNFNRGAADIGSGAPDDENGRFTELGWAKPFRSSGAITRTVTWNVDDPSTPPVVSGEGSPRFTPGGEDRADGRNRG